MKKIFNILSILCVAVLAVSCSSDQENNEQVGYLKLDVTTLVSTHTRVTGVPSGYNAKTLHVELRNSEGTVVMQTDDFDNASDFQGTIMLQPGTYTIDAHSANWDGSDSGFGTPYYTGSASVTIKAKELTTASLTLTQANVKVTVIYDSSFQTYFNSAQTIITSALSGVAPRVVVMGSSAEPVYFPVGNLNFMINVTNKKGQSFVQNNTIENVAARDHYIITYKVADAGSIGGVTVVTDDATQSYTYTVEVPRKSSTALSANSATAWGDYAELTGAVTTKTSNFDASAVVLQWKTSEAEDWTTVANSQLTNEGDNYSYTLSNLSPWTSYTYRFVYQKDDVEVNSNELTFTTTFQNTGTALYNGSFEYWHYESRIAYPTESENVTYWSSSNPGSGSVTPTLATLTDKTEDYVHSGAYAAKLQSKKAFGVLAAASLYTGSFGSLDLTSQVASLNWGVPFTDRPIALKGYMSYKPGSVNVVSTSAKDGTPLPSDAPAEGALDHCQIYCALMNIDASLTVNNGDLSTFPNWQTDSRVIAYGAITQKTTQDGWVEFTIPLDYHNTTLQPKYIIIVASASKYGDYFHGSGNSILYLDDFELVYGPNVVTR